MAGDRKAPTATSVNARQKAADATTDGEVVLHHGLPEGSIA